MAVIFQEVQNGERIQDIIASNLFARAELLIRENHGKAEDERSYAWLSTDFVIELNFVFRSESDDDAIQAWRRRLLLIAFEGGFTRDTALVSVEDGHFLADPELEEWANSGAAGFTQGILPLLEKHTAREAYDRLDKPSPARVALNEAFLTEMMRDDGNGAACRQGGGGDEADICLDPRVQASKLLAEQSVDDGFQMTDAPRLVARAGSCLKSKHPEKKKAWEEMKNRGLWLPVVRQWGRKVPNYFPALCANANLDQLYRDMQHLSIPIENASPEKFDLDALQEYLNCAARKTNLEAILMHLRAAQAGEAGVKNRGRLSEVDMERLQAWSRHEESLKSMEAAAQILLEKIDGTDGLLQVRYRSLAIQGVCVRSRR